jgi:hypothetical protein
MDNQPPKSAWRCNECGTWHDDDYEARDCCAPSICEGWKCETCGSYHEDDVDTCSLCEIDAAGDEIPLLQRPITDLERAANLKLF